MQANDKMIFFIVEIIKGWTSAIMTFILSKTLINLKIIFPIFYISNTINSYYPAKSVKKVIFAADMAPDRQQPLILYRTDI